VKPLLLDCLSLGRARAEVLVVAPAGASAAVVAVVAAVVAVVVSTLSVQKHAPALLLHARDEGEHRVAARRGELVLNLFVSVFEN